jgi:putative ABC transport system permease protein
MKFTEVLRKANHNTWNRKLRSILTILSVTVGATTLTLAIALGAGAQNLVQTSINSGELKNAVTVRKIPQEIVEMQQREQEEEQKGVPEYDPNDESQVPQADPGMAVITADDMAQIGAIKGVEAVHLSYRVPALFLNLEGRDFLANIQIAEPNREHKPQQGQTISALNQTGILLSKTYAESIGVADADLVGKAVTVTFINPETERTAARTLPVIGVMADIFGSFESIVNYDTIKSVAEELDMRDTNMVIATLAEGYRDDASMLSISELIEGISPQFNVSSSAEERGEAKIVIRIFRIGLISFAAIVLLAALFGISNTLLMSVLERTQDIGLMRALGAKKSSIFAIFAMESALIGFWGAVVGILIGMGLGEIGNLILRRLEPEVFTGDISLLEFDPLSMLGIIAALAFVAFLAGTLPARKAAKTNVINALRYE